MKQKKFFIYLFSFFRINAQFIFNINIRHIYIHIYIYIYKLIHIIIRLFFSNIYTKIK
jgi:hypothetical protein